ncbi:MAG: polyprenyl synthetase [Actinobacteria bacterium HGW-Actinobacteria-4]|nr:MAG: polyprenyl synthetase [Actinobacteria bacterium HGW-Actinobacteria-4]
MNSPHDAWKPLVAARIDSTLDATARAIAPVGEAGDDLLDAIRTGSVGGKLLRAMLLLASHEAHGGSNLEPAIGVAAALELFQTAALIHDDVLDDSDTRRGKPASHRAIAHLHESRGWDGSAQDFGKAGGVLAGDIALMASYRALHEALADVGEAERALTAPLFLDMTDLVTAGQYLDMRIAAQPLAGLERQEDDIRATMRSKTASYSAEFPLALGAALAGANRSAITAIRAVGVPLGIAFQLRDDVLGLVGRPDVTGKPAGDDIREGKRTLVALYAWRAANPAQRDTLAVALGNRRATAAQVAAAVHVMSDTGALDAAEAEIADLAAGALDALHGLNLHQPGASIVAQTFTAATTRSA